MFCRYCGAQTADDAVFCPKCGKRLSVPADEPSKEHNPVEPPDGGEKRPAVTKLRPEKKKLLVAAGGGLLALLLLSAVLGGGKDNHVPGNQTKPSVSAGQDASADQVKHQTINYKSGAVYEGETVNGKPNGYGVMTHSNGDRYEGEWADGDYEGHGVYTFSSGIVFEGEFIDDQREGDGVYRFTDGSTLEGVWSGLETNGEYRYTNQAGEVYRRVYENSKCVSSELISSGSTSTTSKPASGSSGFTASTPTTSKPISSSTEPVLPDPGLFLDCARGEDQAYTSHDCDGWLVSYSFDMEDGATAVEEFRKLLEEDEYHLTLNKHTTQDNISSSGRKWENYYYDYTGKSKDIGEVVDWTKDRGAVMLSVGYYYDQGRIGLTLYYHRNFTLEDAGTRASKPPEDYNGGGSGSSGSSSGSGSSGGSTSTGSGITVKCTKCRGEGTIACTNCDGLGYKEKRVSTPNYSGNGVKYGTTKENCIKCRGSGTITCTRCHGSGHE